MAFMILGVWRMCAFSASDTPSVEASAPDLSMLCGLSSFFSVSAAACLCLLYRIVLKMNLPIVKHSSFSDSEARITWVFRYAVTYVSVDL